jgi:hypothetical protein
MSFTPNIPASGESLGASRLEVLNNFASLRTTISNVTQPNHVDVNASGAGKHVFVQMPVQTTGAANLPGANEGGLIAKTAAGSSELFYVRDAVSNYIQMTTGTPISGNNGSTFLPGGMILKWFRYGQTSASNVITFVGAGIGNFPNAVFGAVQGVQNAAFKVGYSGLTTSQVTLLMNPTSGPSIDCFIAILGN